MITISLRRFNLQHPLILLLFVCVSWEIVEHYIEISGVEPLSGWFAGQENVVNRLITDQLCAILGFFLIKAFPKWRLQYIALGILFYSFHIYVGNSMFFYPG